MQIASKNAILRYRIIDKSIRSKSRPFPSKKDLRKLCEEELFGSTRGLHISDSTIEKDIQTLRKDHGAPIAYSRKEDGYYYTEPTYSIDDSPLNDRDIDAIKMAATVLYQFKDSHLFQNFDFAISKILDRVNISNNINDKEVDSYVQFEKVNKVQGGEYLEPLLTAIKNRQKVQFEYQSFNSEHKKIRRVHPYLLKEYRHRWYLIGRSELKDTMRTFGLDRLTDLQVLENKFAMQKDFAPDLYFKYSIGITTNTGHPEQVIIETNELLSKYLISQPIHTSQVYKGAKGTVHTFEYFLLPTYELRMLLLGFGSEVKVIAPKSLAANLKKTCEDVIASYTKPDA